MRRYFFASISVLVFSLCFASISSGRDLTYRFPQDQVIAAYLLNFAYFSKWPESAFNGADSFVIATFDRDFAELAVASLAGQRVGKRNLRIRFITSLEEISAAQMVYLTKNEQHRVATIIAHIGQQPVLTVGALPDFNSAGGMVELFLVNQRLRFAVNLRAVEKSTLRISSEVLQLADHIETEPRSERSE